MSATKVTLMFNAVTLNSAGAPERSAGFSESYYSDQPLDSSLLSRNWTNLCEKRANLLPANVSIIGSRYQTVDPVGASRQFDNKYVGNSTAACDLPGVALQWTVRSANTPNQRNLILRGTPDGRVANGEYSPSSAYAAALMAFFAELTTNWKFRAIDRTVLPQRIIDITGGLMTTPQAHGLVVGNTVNIMSTFVGTDPGVKTSYSAFVRAVPTVTTATLIPIDAHVLPTSTGGRVRKVGIIYPTFSITNGEIQTPTAIHRKAGAPFKKFRGRRTVRH